MHFFIDGKYDKSDFNPFKITPKYAFKLDYLFFLLSPITCRMKYSNF